MIIINRKHDIPISLEMDTLRQINLNDIDFHRSILDNLDFSLSVLCNIDFRSAELNRSKFSASTIEKSKLIMVEAKKAIFDECRFIETVLLHSDFSCSSFRLADLSKAVVNNVVFSMCDLRGADMTCLGLETCSFIGAIYDETTKWNDEFDLVGSGAIKRK